MKTLHHSQTLHHAPSTTCLRFDHSQINLLITNAVGYKINSNFTSSNREVLDDTLVLDWTQSASGSNCLGGPCIKSTGDCIITLMGEMESLSERNPRRNWIHLQFTYGSEMTNNIYMNMNIMHAIYNPS